MVDGNHPWHPWTITMSYAGCTDTGYEYAECVEEIGFRYRNLWIPYRFMIRAVSGSSKKDNIHERAYYLAARELME